MQIQHFMAGASSGSGLHLPMDVPPLRVLLLLRKNRAGSQAVLFARVCLRAQHHLWNCP